MARDKQARAARRAAERAELERRRLEARANRTWADDARDVFDHATYSGPPDMEIGPELRAMFEAADRKPRTVTYTASYARGETIPARRG